MTRLVTKQDREDSRKYQFDSLLASGYQKTEYKNLVIFTNPETLLLKTFWGSAANHTDFFRYRTAEQMQAKVNDLIKTADAREHWKAKQKEQNNGHKSSQANCAAAIRVELKAKFPAFKFSVTSEGFSGGDAVRIQWTDGPTSKEVEEITGKYQYGSFNGMEDIYEHTNSRSDIPQAKYITESRHMSDTAKAALLPSATTIFETSNIQGPGMYNADSFLYRIFSRTSFPSTGTPVRIESIPNACGLIEECYRVVFEGEKPQTVQVPAGKIQIVEYSEKSVAVIGETYPHRKGLADLGGRFNKFLTCGAGWVFPKTKIEELKAYLIRVKQEDRPDTLRTEIEKTVEAMADMDLKTQGQISKGTLEAAQIQSVDVPEIYTTLKDITEAAEGGKIISLYNLSQLIGNV